MSKFQDLFNNTAFKHIQILYNKLADLSGTESQPNIIADLHLHAHSLKSEFLVMGYKNSGTYTAVIEQYLRSLKDSNNVPDKNKLDILKQALKEIENALKLIQTTSKEPEDLKNKEILLQEQLK